MAAIHKTLANVGEEEEHISALLPQYPGTACRQGSERSIPGSPDEHKGAMEGVINKEIAGGFDPEEGKKMVDDKRLGRAGSEPET
ncbi:hypothetical protein E2562_018361 [Oryza meyeriana var. granulata]|uniref:Uncharacterized protein n=1 Tax=Oryza meyeriana var. granulata TaxID=110450 RepID=A0A6G1D479_9ORYZ|nr:hypothetical protein E2562_018361 [Oryza meyeriana var. granulata]